MKTTVIFLESAFIYLKTKVIDHLTAFCYIDVCLFSLRKENNTFINYLSITLTCIQLCKQMVLVPRTVRQEKKTGI